MNPKFVEQIALASAGNPEVLRGFEVAADASPGPWWERAEWDTPRCSRCQKALNFSGALCADCRDAA